MFRKFMFSLGLLFLSVVVGVVIVVAFRAARGQPTAIRCIEDGCHWHEDEVQVVGLWTVDLPPELFESRDLLQLATRHGLPSRVFLTFTPRGSFQLFFYNGGTQVLLATGEYTATPSHLFLYPDELLPPAAYDITAYSDRLLLRADDVTVELTRLHDKGDTP